MITARLHQNANWPTRWSVTTPDTELYLLRHHFFAPTEQDALAYAANVLAARYPDKHHDLELVIE